MRVIDDLKHCMRTLGCDTKDTLSILKAGTDNLMYTFKRYVSLTDHVRLLSPREVQLLVKQFKRLPEEYFNQTKKKPKEKSMKGYIVVNTTETVDGIIAGKTMSTIPNIHRPKLIQHTQEAAEQEAERLAKQYEGQTFIVFAAIAAWAVVHPVTRVAL